jgi:cyanate permease
MLVPLGGQAAGPIAARFLFDATGSYVMTFFGFAGVVAISSLLVLTAVPPSQPDIPVASDVGSAA